MAGIKKHSVRSHQVNHSTRNSPIIYTYRFHQPGLRVFVSFFQLLELRLVLSSSVAHCGALLFRLSFHGASLHLRGYHLKESKMSSKIKNVLKIVR